jgi:hypothetical protein
MAELNKEELHDLVRLVVKETLVGLGADVENPMEMQQDFQSLREWRITADTIKKKTLVVCIGTIVAGIIAAIWIGIKSILAT